MNRILAAAAAAAILAGCGGGGSMLPNSVAGGSAPSGGVPFAGDSRATASVTANATVAASRIPALYRRSASAASRKTYDAVRHTSSIAQVEIDGTLYQGAASAVPVTNVQKVTPAADGTIVVSETFSNVVPTTNDWISFEFFAIAVDGSKYNLGSLATLVNVANGGTNVTTLSAQSTQVVQVAQALLATGHLSTYDIEQNASLATDLATKLAATGVTANAQTQLLDPTSVATAAGIIAPQYDAELTISVPAGTGSGNEEFTVAYDSSQQDENDLFYNLQQVTNQLQFGNNAQPVFTGPTSVAGAPNPQYQFASPILPFHSPSSGALHATPAVVFATMVAPGASSVKFHNVYRGHLIVGAHDPGGILLASAARASLAVRQQSVAVAPTGLGGNALVAPAAPGASSTASVTLSTTSTQVQIADPQAVAFAVPGASSNFYNAIYQFELAPSSTQFGLAPVYQVICDTSNYSRNCSQYGLPGNLSGGFSLGNSSPPIYRANESINPSTSTLTFDTWNAFGVPASLLRICSFTTCSPIAASVPAQSTFFDPGTKIGVYGWTGGDTNTTVAQSVDVNSVPNGYTVSYTIPAGQNIGGNNLNPITAAIQTSNAAMSALLISPAELALNTRGAFPNTTSLKGTFTDAAGHAMTVDTTRNGYCYNNSSTSQGCYAGVEGGAANLLSTQIKSILLTFTIPAGAVPASSTTATTGTFTLKYLETYYNN
ncbi:MAG: hypothetical protein JWN27_4569 [Candidatus Eremiobacteraeota bacterium]|nr:hypothetical protein [Candidatus Eremiobacteraeota bacterium]